MKTFKVYLRYQGKNETVYVDAPSTEALRWRILSRYYFSTVLNLVEMK